jgi:hypothetical protein
MGWETRDANLSAANSRRESGARCAPLSHSKPLKLFRLVRVANLSVVVVNH